MSSNPAADVLLSAEAIQARVAELAAQISADYAGVDSLFLIGVLRGAYMFVADLARRITVPLQVDFIALASYADDSRRGGEVRLLLDLRKPVADRHVLIVEDIVDSGQTMDYLLRLLSARQPASLRVCTLLRKPERLELTLPLDYVGFDIPDEWVVGYGLDLADHYRNLSYIGVLQPRVTAKESPTR